MLSEPLYARATDGATARDPRVLLGPAPRFRLGRLAPMLEGLPFEAEFPPLCPWDGLVRRTDPVALDPPGSSDDGELVDQFRASVARAIGDAPTVLVLASGGMDSSAVLVHAARQCAREGRRLHAVVWNLRDQLGRATAALVHRQLRALDLRCELHVLPADWRRLPEPAWSAEGPRHDYYTRLHQATVDRAEAVGAELILTGQGGDEVLGAWHHLSGGLARGRRWRDLRRYLAAFGTQQSVVELAAEAAAVLARPLPGATAFRWYSAVALRGLLAPGRPPVLTPPYAKQVRQWTDDWLRDRLRAFEEGGRDWAAASVWDAVFPCLYAAHPLGVPVRQRSPFVDEQFLRWSFGLPPASRFRADGPHPYTWYKALHLRLVPPALRGLLPEYKQSYSEEFRRYALDVLPDGPLVSHRLGLLRPWDKLDLERIHPRLLITVRNVDRWVEGALAAGAEPVEQAPLPDAADRPPAARTPVDARRGPG